jgi:uncharacterized membrane protein YgaE (UPF0421/DUF939 family)
MDPLGLLLVVLFGGLSISIGVKLMFVIAQRYDPNMNMVLLAAAVAQAIMVGIPAVKYEIVIVMVTLNVIGLAVGAIYNWLKPLKPRPSRRSRG